MRIPRSLRPGVAVVAVATVAVTGADVAEAAPAPAGDAPPDPRGHTIVASLDNGLVAEQKVSPDGHLITLSVLSPGSTSENLGPVGTYEVWAAPVAGAVWQVSWIEPSGAVISNVQDNSAGVEHVFYSFERGGGRGGEQHDGRVELRG